MIFPGSSVTSHAANKESSLIRYIFKCGPLFAIAGLFRKRKGKKMSRSQRRKFITRRRRWFTDNIIMHHRRLHKKNRDIVLEPEKDQELAKKRKKKKDLKSLDKEKKRNKERSELRQKGQMIKGRIDARRLKARSLWLTLDK